MTTLSTAQVSPICLITASLPPVPELVLTPKPLSEAYRLETNVQPVHDLPKGQAFHFLFEKAVSIPQQFVPKASLHQSAQLLQLIGIQHFSKAQIPGS